MFEGVAIDTEKNEEYTTSMKFICKDDSIEEIEVSTTIEFGLNMYNVDSYMRTRDDFKLDKNSETKRIYVKK